MGGKDSKLAFISFEDASKRGNYFVLFYSLRLPKRHGLRLFTSEDLEHDDGTS